MQGEDRNHGKKVHGVETANWIIDTKQLHLTFDKSHTDLDEVKKAIADAGHDNDKYRAPDTIYNSLSEVLSIQEIMSNPVKLWNKK